VPEQQQRPSSAASNRNNDELEYLERLRQIRQQNYNERKNLQAKQDADSAVDRKKKIDALRVSNRLNYQGVSFVTNPRYLFCALV